jgi:hypothetical protein
MDGKYVRGLHTWRLATHQRGGPAPPPIAVAPTAPPCYPLRGYARISRLMVCRGRAGQEGPGEMLKERIKSIQQAPRPGQCSCHPAATSGCMAPSSQYISIDVWRTGAGAGCEVRRGPGKCQTTTSDQPPGPRLRLFVLCGRRVHMPYKRAAEGNSRRRSSPIVFDLVPFNIGLDVFPGRRGQEASNRLVLCCGVVEDEKGPCAGFLEQRLGCDGKQIMGETPPIRPPGVQAAHTHHRRTVIYFMAPSM